MPTISVVIPTRDRPLFVREALKSLAAQEFTDFEAIVADNPETTPCEEVVKEFGDERFRYQRAERPLAMHDNWEAGCAAASGEYVGLMNDKIVWLPSTMSHALALLERASVEVVSWWCSSFEPRDEASAVTSGDYYPYDHPSSGPAIRSSRSELTAAMAFDAHRGLGPGYFRGNICSGLYRQDVMNGIRDRLGRVFPPISPDHTSRVGALMTVPRFVDAGVPLQIACTTANSTLRAAEQDPQYSERLLRNFDPELIDRLPNPGLWSSLHNIIAHDYLIAEQLGGPRLNRWNLVARARDDLSDIDAWPSGRVRRQQYRLLRAAERRPGQSVAAIQADRVGKELRRLLAAIRDAPAPRHLLHRMLLRVPGLSRRLRARAAAQLPPPETLAGAISAAEAELAERGHGRAEPEPQV